MFLQKNITISSVEDKGMQIKIKASDGKSYTFFKKKKDGSSTEAFAAFPEYRVGDTTGISYVENPDKNDPKIVYKNIMSFMPILSEQIIAKSQANTVARPQYEPLPEEFPVSNERVEVLPQDAFGRRLALHGFVNARLQTHTIQQVKGEIDELLNLEDFINSKLS